MDLLKKTSGFTDFRFTLLNCYVALALAFRIQVIGLIRQGRLNLRKSQMLPSVLWMMMYLPVPLLSWFQDFFTCCIQKSISVCQQLFLEYWLCSNRLYSNQTPDHITKHILLLTLKKQKKTNRPCGIKTLKNIKYSASIENINSLRWEWKPLFL